MPVKKIITPGDRFGNMTVLGHDSGYIPRVLCRCDCGTIESISATRLRRGSTLSCGCIDLQKQCKKCGKVTADVGRFSNGRLICRECYLAYQREWTVRNRERRRAISRESASRLYDSEKAAGVFARWYAKTKVNGTYARQVERVTRRCRLISQHATPAWASTFIIDEFYDCARQRSAMTGVEHHVDHIVPLQSELVCGLHVQDNLRVIPAFSNRSKRNRHWPDMPELTTRATA